MKTAPHRIGTHGEDRRDTLLMTAIAICLLLPMLSLVIYRSVTLPADPVAAFEERRQSVAADQARLSDLSRWRKAVSEDPRDITKWMGLGRAFMNAGDYEGAIQAYTNAASLSERGVESLAGLAEAMVRRDNGAVSADAKKLLEEIQGKSADLPPILFYLGVAAEQEKQYEKMTDYWRRLVEVSPENTPWIPLLRQRINELASRESLAVGELLARTGLPPT